MFMGFFFEIVTPHNSLSSSNLQKNQNEKQIRSPEIEKPESKLPLEIPAVKQPEWDLIWNDEFDDSALDLSKWTPEDWAATKNNELQYYLPNNIFVDSGYLHLTSKKENYGGRTYTSGAIQSSHKFNFRYGKVEMRAKLPAGKGVFPAFWMMPANKNAWLPEIDIVEMVGHKPEEIWMVHHRADSTGKLASEFTSFKGKDFSKDFHTFALEWSPQHLIWSIDGVERFRTDSNIPNEEMYLYANTAIGGNWPGSPDASTIFPVSYVIDYFRVYKKAGEDRP